MKRHMWKKLILAGILAAGMALAGCSADDGSTGATGPQGDQGLQGPAGPGGPAGSSAVDIATLSPEGVAALSISGEVTGVTIASPPVVDFKLTDAAGRGLKGLTTSNLRFALAKLVPGANGSPDAWVSYMVTETSRPGTENVAAGLVDNGDGSYTYTFTKDVATVPGVTYEPSLTHRMAIQISGGGLSPALVAHDFIPAGGDVVTLREIVSKDACNSCHDTFTFHGGSRQDPKLCVVCHTDQRRIGRPEATVNADGTITGDASGRTYVVNGQALGNFVNLVHKIHMSHDLTLTGYNYANVLFNEITYPQSPANCRKCHTGDNAATPQGDNWKSKPSRLACGACHDGVNFATGAGHSSSNIALADDTGCAGCHTPAAIETAHASLNATPNNPNVPAGAVNITYNIKEVTVNGTNNPVVTFSILADGQPMNLATFPPAGFTGAPGFLVTYAQAQDGVATPIDYNNLGRSFGQPASVSLSQALITAGTANADGSYTVTLTSATFPAGSTLRALVMQGTMTQTGIGSRQTPMVVKGVTGDPVRREVVDSAKCGNCHEWFVGHGGSRVYNVQGCLACHNPSMTASGRAIVTPNAATVAEVGSDPLLYPEVPGNFKDMIHGIHGRQAQEAPYIFVRNRQNGVVVSSDHVEFPSQASNCLVCHKTDSFALPLKANGLLTTDRITGEAGGNDADTAAVNAARDAMPNDTDWVNTPTASTCFYCHDSALAVAHMEQNGGAIQALRGDVTAQNPVEACALCHGPGRSADLKVVHGLK